MIERLKGNQNSDPGRRSLGAQVRMVAMTSALMAMAFLKERPHNSPEWEKARRNELAALKAYEDAPPGPEKEKAHMDAQEAWRHRDTIEAAIYDPKPDGDDA